MQSSLFKVHRALVELILNESYVFVLTSLINANVQIKS